MLPVPEVISIITGLHPTIVHVVVTEVTTDELIMVLIREVAVVVVGILIDDSTAMIDMMIAIKLVRRDLITDGK